MRKYMLMLVAAVWMLTAMSAPAPKKSQEKWVRPVVEDINCYKYGSKDTTTLRDRIRIFKGEYVRVITQTNRLIIQNGDTLTGSKLYRSMERPERYSSSKHGQLKVTCQAVGPRGDSIEVNVNFDKNTDYALIIDQKANKILDTLWRGRRSVITGVDTASTLRISPKGHLATFKRVGDIEGYMMSADPAAEEEGISTLATIILWALVIIAVLIVYIVIRKIIHNVSYRNAERRRRLEAREVKLMDMEHKIEERARRLAEREHIFNKDTEKLRSQAKHANDLEIRLEACMKELNMQSKGNMELKDKNMKLTQALSDESKKIEAQCEMEKRRIQDRMAKVIEEGKMREAQLENTIKIQKAENDKLNFKLAKAAQEALPAEMEAAFVSVPFAAPYAAGVAKFVELTRKVVSEAVKVLDLPMEDPYHIQKFIARYTKAVSEIDISTMLTELSTIGKSKAVLRGTRLGAIDKDQPDTFLTTQVKYYYYDNYLRALVNAVVVLNESMAGADKLVEDLPADSVRVFGEFRQSLATAYGALGLAVESVQMFDKADGKPQLKVTKIDVGFDPGDILEIENVIVYIKGFKPKNAVIGVKVQE